MLSRVKCRIAQPCGQLDCNRNAIALTLSDYQSVIQGGDGWCYIEIKKVINCCIIGSQRGHCPDMGGGQSVGREIREFSLRSLKT